MSNGFYAINPIAGQKSSSPACAAGVVNTMIGLTISTDGTVVFWGMWAKPARQKVNKLVRT